MNSIPISASGWSVNSDSWSFSPIGTLHSPFRQKFGIPRQPGLAATGASLILHPPHNRPEALRGLSGFSHLWLVFVFHGHGAARGTTVRPPRLGGRERLGTFATRSSYRPNPIGLSAVRLLEVNATEGRLELEGADLLDGTPILDIKPYLPYADAHPDARAGFAPEAPQPWPVAFTAAVHDTLARHPDGTRLALELEQVLALDPRPAHAAGEARAYRMRYADFDVVMTFSDGVITVTDLEVPGVAP